MAKGYVGTQISYTPVEYIESGGTQYIDTGFAPDQNTNMQIDFQYLGQNSQVSTLTSICIAGVRQVAASNKLVFWIERSTSKVALNYGTYDSGFVQNTNCSQRTTLKNQGCSLIYNGTTVASGTSSNFASTYNILLFGLTSINGSADLRGIIMKLYSFKIWDNGTLVRDLIPVLDQDNVACLYDLVEGKFYYNKGTGTFTAGSTTGQPVLIGDVARKIKKGYVGINNVARKIKKGYVGIPSYYTPVEYIESTGTQYIDTGYVPNSNTKVELKVSDFPATGSKWQALYGARTESTTSDKFSMHCNSNNIYVFDYGSYRTQFPSGMSIVNETVITQNKNVATIGSETVTCSSTTFTSSCSTYIFALNSNTYISDKSAFKLYYFKIWDNGELVRDFIPVVNQDGVACLYDQVESKFYYNLGTGVFAAGSETGQPVYIGDVARLCFMPYKPLEYIESSGTQFIDTGYIPKANTKFILDCYVISNTHRSFEALFGARTSRYATGAYIFFSRVNSSNVPGYNRVGSEVTGSNMIYNKRIILTTLGTTATWTDGTNTYSLTISGTPTNSSYSLRIFDLNNGGAVDGSYSEMKLYSFKAYENDILVRNFIPVKDDNGVACLYELVEGRFYYNMSSNSFIAGPEKTLSESEQVTTTSTNSLNIASLMNTGSLIGMGDRAELLANEVADKDVGEQEVKEVTPLETTEEKTEGSGDIL